MYKMQDPQAKGTDPCVPNAATPRTYSDRSAMTNVQSVQTAKELAQIVTSSTWQTPLTHENWKTGLPSSRNRLIASKGIR